MGVLLLFVAAALGLTGPGRPGQGAPRRAPAATLVGRVTMLPAGEPAPGVAIALEPADSTTRLGRDEDGFERTSLRTVSDSLGDFRFPGLSPGFYRVGVLANELPDDRTTQNSDRFVRLRAPGGRAPADTVRLSVLPAGCAQGTVSGMPEAGLAGDTWVLVSDLADTLFESSGPIGADGAFRLCRVPAGVPVRALAVLPGGRARRSAPFEVRSGGVAEVPAIAFPPLDSTNAAPLSLLILKPDGTPAPGVTAELSTASESGEETFRRDLQIDETGRTPELWVRAGRYRARFANPAPGTSLFEMAFDHVAGAAHTVTVRLPR